MSRTSSILVDPADKAGFGAFLGWALRLANKDGAWLKAQFRSGALSKHERRPADIEAYLTGEKTPDLANLERLAAILEVPRGAMLTAGGYVEVVLATLARAAHQNETGEWEREETPRVAALERLLTLFPTLEMDTALNQSGALSWIIEKMGRYNLMNETEPLHKLWPFWVWVMPNVIEQRHMIHREQRDLKAYVAAEPLMQPEAPERKVVYRAIRCERQSSLADAASDALFSMFYSNSLAESDALLVKALTCLKDRGQSWPDRAKLATHYVHQWADDLHREISENLRRRLKGIEERPISAEDEAYMLGMIKLGDADRKPHKAPPKFE